MNVSGVAYIDSSAFVKLVVTEPESAALAGYLTRWPRWASAALLRTEGVRAARRHHPQYLAPARQQLAGIDLVHMTEPLLDYAATMNPAELRSLDSIHLAAALSLGSDLGVFVSYDERLIEAARQQGLPVSSPH